jgi:hypothetical protein
MDPVTMMLLAVAVLLLRFALRSGPEVALAGLSAGGRALWKNLALLLLGSVTPVSPRYPSPENR